MAINEFTNGAATEKWATVGNWSLGVKPTAAHDVKIPTGKSVKIEAAAVCRSLSVEGNAKVSGASGLTIGNSEKPEGPAGVSWALKISTEAVITYTGAIRLESSTAETQKFSVGVSLPGGLTVGGSTTTYLLEAALTITNTSGFAAATNGKFDSGGFAITAPKVELGEKFTAKLHASTIKLTATNITVWQTGGSGTLEASASTIIMEGAGAVFFPTGGSYGTVTCAANKQSIEGSPTIATLNVNNKGAPVGEGVRLQKLTTTTVTTLTTNGTEASPARLESNEAAASATLAVAEQEVTSWLIIKDITVPTGVLYIPKPAAETANAGGNLTVGTTIKFEAKPSGSKTQKFEVGLTFAGTLPRATNRALPASVSFTGGLPRAAAHGLAASVSFLGTLPRATRHNLSGSVSFTGSLPRSIVRGFAAVVSFLGALPRSVAHALPAGLSFTGAAPRVTSHTLPASVTFQGAVPRNTARGFTASVSFAGALKRAVTHPLTASLPFAGVLPRNTVHALPASLSSFVSMSPIFGGAFVKHLSATLSFAGTLPSRTVKQFPTSVSFAGALQRSTSKGLPAGVTFAGALPKVAVKGLAASVSFAGTLRRTILHPVTATLSFAGSLRRNIMHRIEASVGLTGHLSMFNPISPQAVPTRAVFDTAQTRGVLAARRTRGLFAKAVTRGRFPSR